MKKNWKHYLVVFLTAILGFLGGDQVSNFTEPDEVPSVYSSPADAAEAPFQEDLPGENGATRPDQPVQLFLVGFTVVRDLVVSAPAGLPGGYLVKNATDDRTRLIPVRAATLSKDMAKALISRSYVSPGDSVVQVNWIIKK